MGGRKCKAGGGMCRPDYENVTRTPHSRYDAKAKKWKSTQIVVYWSQCLRCKVPMKWEVGASKAVTGGEG